MTTIIWRLTPMRYSLQLYLYLIESLVGSALRSILLGVTRKYLSYYFPVILISSTFPFDTMMTLRYVVRFFRFYFIKQDILVRIFSTLLENNTVEQVFYEDTLSIRLVNVIIAKCLYEFPYSQYQSEVDIVGEACRTLQSLLISCCNVVNKSDFSRVSVQKKMQLLSLMESIFNSNIFVLLSFHLEKVGIDQLESASKICFFIQVFFQFDLLVEGDSLFIRNFHLEHFKDYFRSQHFGEIVLIKVLQTEFEYYSTITKNVNASIKYVQLGKERSIFRMRIFLQLLYFCLPSKTLKSSITKLLTNAKFTFLFKEFPFFLIASAEHEDPLLPEEDLFNQREEESAFLESVKQMLAEEDSFSRREEKSPLVEPVVPLLPKEDLFNQRKEESSFVETADPLLPKEGLLTHSKKESPSVDVR